MMLCSPGLKVLIGRKQSYVERLRECGCWWRCQNKHTLSTNCTVTAERWVLVRRQSASIDHVMDVVLVV